MSNCLVKYYTNERDNYFYDYYYKTSTNIKRAMCVQGYYFSHYYKKRPYFRIKKIIFRDTEGQEQIIYFKQLLIIIYTYVKFKKSLLK